MKNCSYCSEKATRNLCLSILSYLSDWLVAPPPAPPPWVIFSNRSAVVIALPEVVSALLVLLLPAVWLPDVVVWFACANTDAGEPTVSKSSPKDSVKTIVYMTRGYSIQYLNG